MARMLSLAVAVMIALAVPANAECARLSAAFIFFGEQTTRAQTLGELDSRVKRWAGGQRVRVSSRTVRCESYLRLLNEYKCHSFATVCRR